MSTKTTTTERPQMGLNGHTQDQQSRTTFWVKLFAVSLTPPVMCPPWTTRTISVAHTTDVGTTAW
jgi:hypothetical protein